MKCINKQICGDADGALCNEFCRHKTKPDELVCKWSEYPEKDGYTTSCGIEVWLDDRIIKGVWKFCPYCGLPITVEELNR